MERRLLRGRARKKQRIGPRADTKNHAENILRILQNLCSLRLTYADNL